MKYLSVCSGIEAASVAWGPLGFEPVAFSEIEKFPCAVLAHHYPSVPNWGDMTKFESWPNATIDILVGGTPCQSFSYAGLRAGLADPRGNLALTYLAIAERYRPRWLVWENVPGVLSSAGGRDFGSFLGALVELGYGFAYRVLDAQYFGLAQRRKRVFVVGYLGNWQYPAAVLFERESLSGHPAPRREAGSGVARTPTSGAGTCGADDNQGQAGHLIPQPFEVADTPTHRTHKGINSTVDEGQTPVVVPILEAGARTGKSTTDPRAGIGIGDDGDPMFTLQAGKQHAIAFSSKDDGMAVAIGFNDDQSEKTRSMGERVEQAPTLRAGGSVSVALRGRDGGGTIELGDDKAHALRASQGGGDKPHVLTDMAVRRLTPRECERLQGFPDDYTLIGWRRKAAADCPDGPRYKAIGNAMAVPVMRWIGERIHAVGSGAFLRPGG